MHVLTFTHQNGIEDCFQADFSFCIQGVPRTLFLLLPQGGISIFLKPSKGKQPSCLTYQGLPVSR